MAQVKPISEVKDYKTGDILQTTTSIMPFVKHYAIVFYRNGIPHVADNSFITKRIDVFTLDEYKKQRNVVGLIRDENTEKVKDATVEQAIINYKDTGYKFFTYNCEDFIREICNCSFGMDQRITYLLIIPAAIISIIIGLIFFFKKYPITAKILLLFLSLRLGIIHNNPKMMVELTYTNQVSLIYERDAKVSLLLL